MPSTKDWLADAKGNARDAVLHFLDVVVRDLLDGARVSDDMLNDYPDGDSYHHETHVDRWHNFSDAADLLNDLDEWEETDSGLWDGQDMKQALATCAAYTYGNCVYDMWQYIIEAINEDACEPNDLWVILRDTEEEGLSQEKRRELVEARVREIVGDWR